MTRVARRLLLVLLLAAGAAGVAAAEYVPPAPSGFVNDFANVVDADSKARMETMARNFRDATQIDVAVVTLASLEDRPIEDVGLQIGRQWQIGAGQEKNGILILLAPNDRQTRVEVSRHLEGDVPDITAFHIEKDARPLFQQGKFGQGLLGMEEAIFATIAESRGLSIEGIDRSRAVRPDAQPASGGTSRGGGLWLIVLVIFIVVLFNAFGRGGGGGGGGGRRRRGGFTPIIIPGGWGGGGGGGGGSWGGGGGGDSWGGFGGGGDFGGGGSSDSW